MAYSSMWTYVWDLMDEGVDATLEPMKKRIGLAAISVATSYHTVDHLRVHGARPIYFRARRAALYFQPQLALYKKTKIVPNVSALAKTRNPLATISKACEKHGLDLISWTVCMHNSHLCETYPDCAAEDAFGSKSLVALCPSNPNVREYIKALIRDLSANYSMKAIELESIGYESFRHHHLHEKIGIPPGALDRFLLTLCFCQSCRARAKRENVDADHVRNQVARTLLTSFKNGEPVRGTIEEFVMNTAELEGYLDMRANSLAALLADLKKASRAPIITMDEGSRHFTGIGIAQAAEIVDRILLLCYTPSASAVEKQIEQAVESAGNVRKLVAGFHCYPPNSPDAKTLVANVERAHALGLRYFNFYNYGIMPIPNLMWVRDAIASLPK